MANSSVKGDEGFEWGNEIADTDGYTMYKWYKYRGVTYSMYDSVFTFTRGAKNTDIGKITMIWETTNKEKKVKLLWYFRPADILNFLGDYRPNWNELFLASGNGKGLHTVVPLEAILGKCNVLCTSKDRRNTPPSKSDYAEADYFFSHVFDVETRVLSSKLPDTIGPVKVERFLNEVRPKPKANVEGQRAVIRSPQTQDAEKSFTTDFGVKRETSFSVMFEQRPSENQPLKRRKILENEIVGDEEAGIGDGLSAMKLQKPAAEEKWLVKLTGEDEILAAYELRRLVTLINLDPSYTSSDVEEMILFAFKLKVDARIIPRRSSSSPLHGQALVIFNTMDEANFVVSELSRKCLVDDEGRPVVAFKTTLVDPPKTKFPGHFELELHQMKKRATKDKTMSTSQCAQPYTLESQMATQWILLHQRSERWYQAAHKIQAKEIAACMNKLKSRQSNLP